MHKASTDTTSAAGSDLVTRSRRTPTKTTRTSTTSAIKIFNATASHGLTLRYKVNVPAARQHTAGDQPGCSDQRSATNATVMKPHSAQPIAFIQTEFAYSPMILRLPAIRTTMNSKGGEMIPVRIAGYYHHLNSGLGS